MLGGLEDKVFLKLKKVFIKVLILTYFNPN